MMIPYETIKAHMEGIKGGTVDIVYPSMAGRTFTCNCPNPTHPDKHPSCVGDLETGDYNCLGCGFKGTVERG